MDKKDVLNYITIAIVLIGLVAMVYELGQYQYQREVCEKVYNKFNMTEDYCDVCKVFCC